MLLQERHKQNAPGEDGLLEIPAGKIRAFESIYDALRREVMEETGLRVVEIAGENESPIYRTNKYEVINYMPFSCSQNLTGDYPIMVLVFVCHAEGDLLPRTEEAANCRWVTTSKIGEMLNSHPEVFYSMHVGTLRKYVSLCGRRHTDWTK